MWSNEAGPLKHPRSGNQVSMKGQRKISMIKKNAIRGGANGAIAIGSVTLEEPQLISADE